MAIPWRDAQLQLQKAEVFWLSTVRPEGRPHVVPLIAVWLNGALYLATGEGERKAKNLAKNKRVTITTGCNSLGEGLDIVAEGEAVVVSDDAKLGRVVEAYVAKYGERWRLPIGGVLFFEVTPTTAFGFGRSEERPSWGPPPAGGFSQTRWRFQASPAATKAGRNHVRYASAPLHEVRMTVLWLTLRSPTAIRCGEFLASTSVPRTPRPFELGMPVLYDWR